MVSGLHRACVVRKLKIRVTVTDASGVKRTRVTLNGKRLRLHGKTKFTITIDPRKLGRAKNVLRIVATDNAGNAVKRRVLRRCAKHRHAG